MEEAKIEIERQGRVFEASLAQACRQTVEALKEKIEDKLFSPALQRLVAEPLQNPKVIAEIGTALVKAIEKGGIDADISLYIPSIVPAEAVNRLLAADVISRLKEKGVLLSSISGGVEVRLVQDNITIDLSDKAVQELLSGYIRKDFRELIFGA